MSVTTPTKKFEGILKKEMQSFGRYIDITDKIKPYYTTFDLALIGIKKIYIYSDPLLYPNYCNHLLRIINNKTEEPEIAIVCIEERIYPTIEASPNILNTSKIKPFRNMSPFNSIKLNIPTFSPFIRHYQPHKKPKVKMRKGKIKYMINNYCLNCLKNKFPHSKTFKNIYYYLSEYAKINPNLNKVLTYQQLCEVKNNGSNKNI